MTRRVVWWVLVVGLGIAAIAATFVGAWQFSEKNRELPVVADDASKRQAVVEAAKTNTAAILTYKSDTVEQDTKKAADLLTGGFLEYYKQFTSETVIPAAQQNRVSTTATVTRAGVISLTTTRASVLAFVDQTTTSTENPQGKFAGSSVRVGMTLVDGRWLVESFDPV